MLATATVVINYYYYYYFISSCLLMLATWAQSPKQSIYLNFFIWKVDPREYSRS